MSVMFLLGAVKHPCGDRPRELGNVTKSKFLALLKEFTRGSFHGDFEIGIKSLPCSISKLACMIVRRGLIRHVNSLYVQ